MTNPTLNHDIAVKVAAATTTHAKHSATVVPSMPSMEASSMAALRRTQYDTWCAENSSKYSAAAAHSNGHVSNPWRNQQYSLNACVDVFLRNIRKYSVAIMMP